MVRKLKPALVFIMETKNQRRRIQWLKNRCFREAEEFYVDPIGRAGGLGVWWSQELDVTILQYSKNFIHMIVFSRSLKMDSYVTLVYGPPKEQDRSAVWNKICSFAPKDDVAWICLGDFNDLSSPNEKFGGRMRSVGGLLQFQKFISDCNLMDLKFSGSKFTWNNRQLGQDHIKERIDRALCNVAFRERYEKAQVVHLETVGSDHCPLLVHFEFSDKRTPREFKFEQMWIEHPGFKQIVKDAWEAEETEDNIALEVFLKNLNRCKQSLINWSRKEFPNNAKLIESLKRDIQGCYEGEMNLEKRERIKELSLNLEEVWKREEQFWAQRARVNWLKSGDRNTRFFHSSTIRRRQKNKVLKLKTDDDRWIEDEEAIGECFKSFYVGLFKSEGDRDLSTALQFVNSTVSDEDNELLLSPVSTEEVKSAVFGLGDLKAPGPDGFSGIFYQRSWDDVKNSLFKMRAANNELKGFKLARQCPWLTHAFFADDAMFFLKASRQNCEVMKDILNSYCEASGQLANLDKSCIFFSENIPPGIRDEVCEVFGIDVASNPGKYLGLPVMWGRSKREALGFIRSKIQRKIKGWKQNLLSQAGREGQKNEEGKIHWLAWDKLTKAKKEGGMGFRDFECFNLAMLAKQGWRLLTNPEEMWAKIIKGVYFPNCDFLNARKGPRASWAWSSLLEGREVLLEGLCWRVGNGDSISFWNDPWVKDLKDFKISSLSTNETQRNMKVSDFIVGGLWDIAKLRSVVSEEEVQAVLKIPLARSGCADKLVWSKTRCGSYVVKSGYYTASEKKKVKVSLGPSSSYRAPASLWKHIWDVKAVPKFNMESCARMEDWCDSLFTGKACMDDREVSLACSICWQIWKGRCKVAFQMESPGPFFNATTASSLVAEFWKSKVGVDSTTTTLDTGGSREKVRWSKPAVGVLKVNTDGAFSASNKCAGFGVVFRDHNGSVINGVSSSCLAPSAECVEALALREGLMFALERNYLNILHVLCILFIH
ncbi:reverse transcriptase [Senna tora]|uniref:Reverse transcriptase n=1 Tax=Senna tora TaxID=362788 RepID=A0A834TIT6_9FABA|nr:reverse transcriptase [Senna tora]